MIRSHGRIVVIGAGLSGTALACRLLRQLPPGSHVTLIGAPGEIGVGLAYRPICPDFLVNVQASRMSLDADEPDHFVEWLAAQAGSPPPAALATIYARRADYGRYLRDTLFDAVERAKGRVTAEILEGTAVEIRRNPEGLEVRLASGQRFPATHVALCLGNAPPRFHLAKDRVEREALPRMIADPWNDFRMKAIEPNDRILFIGTGLTMIDQLLMLRRNGTTGSVTALSRHGLLPAVHSPNPYTPEPPALPPGAGLRDLARSVIAAGRRLDREGGDWRAVVDGLRPAIQEMWRGLTMAEKRRFRRHLDSFWSVHRHRMPPEIGERVERLQRQGTLTVLAGRVDAVRAARSGVRVAFRRRGSRVAEIQSFDWIINCTGPSRDAGLAENPVAGRLLKAGTVRLDPLGLGLDIDDLCRTIDASGRVSNGLFALGPLTAGRFWEITAVREIRNQVAAVAARIAAEVAAVPLSHGLQSLSDPGRRAFR